MPRPRGDAPRAAGPPLGSRASGCGTVAATPVTLPVSCLKTRWAISSRRSASSARAASFVSIAISRNLSITAWRREKALLSVSYRSAWLAIGATGRGATAPLAFSSFGSFPSSFTGLSEPPHQLLQKGGVSARSFLRPGGWARPTEPATATAATATAPIFHSPRMCPPPHARA